MPEVVGVFREPEFSPGRVEDDAAILERTATAMAARGVTMRLGDIGLLRTTAPAAVLAMCQSPTALAALDALAADVPVINTPAAIRNCHRVTTVQRLAGADVRFPRTAIVDSRAPAPADAAPCWVKRGDVHAMERADVVFAADAAAVATTLAALAGRGITRAVLQEHVPGPVVKFYGVGRTFFRCYTSDPEPPASIETLWEAGRAGAARLGLEVFGGDLVVAADGTPVLIDVNDWPSFARCRDEAADAIVDYLCARLASAVDAAPATEGH